MSELILKALLRLFAIVAKEDQVTRQEREQIRNFLKEHLNESKVEDYLLFFDQFVIATIQSDESDEDLIKKVCDEINQSLTQKQKYIIILDLVRVIVADGIISGREEELLRLICDAFNVTVEDLESIKTFVTIQDALQSDHTGLLIIDTRDDAEFHHAVHIR